MNPPSPILPRPYRQEFGEKSFSLTSETKIYFEGEGAGEIARLLSELLQPATGFAFRVEQGPPGQNPSISLRCEGEGTPDETGFVPENYRIQVTASSALLTAETSSGLACAIQTFRQLLPPEIFSQKAQTVPWNLPECTIEDAPRFRWRGLHLDVARHFFDVKEVCRFIDLLALHRLNVLHLHLTDDQGWRVEIKKYPKLTEEGAWRRQTLIGHERSRPRRYDRKQYGGFFSQKDLREIVKFAARRKVTVVPEIEMPGHAQAAIASYPELGFPGATPEVRCHWGISQYIFNVEESTLQFCRDVLDEVLEIFPSLFIHTGGDEVPKVFWSEDARTQARMAELGVADEQQLQAWFTGQIAQHLRSRGRRLIGWDEILEGGIVEGATVMSWRGEEGGLLAANAGHDVVMSPSASAYLDFFQHEPLSEEPLSIGGLLTTGKVYGYDPIPAALAEEKHHHVLGAQANIWTEYISDANHLYYMAYPRAIAMAECLWLPTQEKNFRRFLSDLAHHRQRLKHFGITPHPSP